MSRLRLSLLYQYWGFCVLLNRWGSHSSSAFVVVVDDVRNHRIRNRGGSIVLAKSKADDVRSFGKISSSLSLLKCGGGADNRGGYNGETIGSTRGADGGRRRRRRRLPVRRRPPLRRGVGQNDLSLRNGSKSNDDSSNDVEERKKTSKQRQSGRRPPSALGAGGGGASHDDDDEDKRGGGGGVAATPENKKGTAAAVFASAATSIDWQALVCDLVALVVVFELIGLIDVIGADDFVSRGGWFQSPFDTLTGQQRSTLPVLAQRLSINGFFWMAATAVSSAVSALSSSSSSATPPSSSANPEDDDGRRRIEATSDDETSQRGAMNRAIQNCVVFVAARLLLAAPLEGWLRTASVASTSALYSSSPTLSSLQNNPVLIEALRECYFVVLAIITVRYLLFKFYQ